MVVMIMVRIVVIVRVYDDCGGDDGELVIMMVVVWCNLEPGARNPLSNLSKTPQRIAGLG